MKLFYKYIYFFSIIALTVLTGSCNNSNTSELNLDCNANITSFNLNGYEGIIDQTEGTITVQVPDGTDVSAMTLEYALSDGAEADLANKSIANFSLPVAMLVSNGDIYRRYTVSVEIDKAKMLSFKINDSYIGTIDDEAKTITVYVPKSVDVTQLIATYTITDGAAATPENDAIIDFSNPVTYTVTHRTATSLYTVHVIPTDIKYTAFVGTASSIDEIESPEEKAAATWMIQNISGAEYISFADINTGNVQLGKYSVIWWHWHVDNYTDAIGLSNGAAEAIPKFKDYYQHGGSLLLTRYATRYLSSLEITLDKASPNNCWGGSEDNPEIAVSPWGISFKGHEDHPLFAGLQTASGKDYVAYLFDKGYAVTNSTAQWHIGSDWGGYNTKEDWQNATAGIALGRSDGDADNESGAIVIAEFPKKGNSGTVISIGSGAFDWYGNGVTTTGSYRSNLTTMTKNAITYLSE
ncbi:DUF4960 domain-containing protein [uncultured Bacteroides sp.]|uniref:DUF4960 domain-containing protein n=1 Tax=uncultured Bacteroides sp. TaxID=162156 RepID=UPI002AAB708F|nr:DUF4960 domain-containing protein [uncultured Bacteroides sp.]